MNNAQFCFGCTAVALICMSRLAAVPGQKEGTTS